MFLEVQHPLERQRRPRDLTLPFGEAGPEGFRAFLASIVEGSDDSIIGTDLAGTILSWNRGAQTLFGYAPDEVVGKHITLLFRPDRHADHTDTLRKITREERIEHFESVRVAKDGTALDVSVILSPIRDTTGHIIGVSAIYRDITLRKLTEARLLKALEAGNAATQAKGEFMDNMSHELRTPMNGILGMTDLLLDCEPTEEQREYLLVLKESGHSLLALISKILDFSRLESKKLRTERVQFALNETVEAVFAEMEPAAVKKGLSLQSDVRPEAPDLVFGDPHRLRQILVNLLENAIKFTVAGQVTLTVGLCPENEHLLSFTVRDTGIGIPADRRVMIFKAFTQADGSLTRHAGGTGLGLAITAGLVELLGGNIGVESDGCHGSAFCFTLPWEHAVNLP
jgi:two-component system sensor histidine kinase/response regulator